MLPVVQTYKLETFALIDRPTKITVVSAGEEGANRDKERLIYQWIGRVDLFEDLYSCVVPESARVLPPPPSSSTTQTSTAVQNGTSISSSQQTTTPKPKAAVPVKAAEADVEESEEEEEEGSSSEEEESEDEEEERNLCQSVSMEVGVTFVSWAITS